MLPHIETEDEAKCLVQETKFYPLGQRGMYGLTPSIRYGGIDATEYLQYANVHMHTIVQTESVKGLENIESIAAVQGIDMIASGKVDLSQSMGIPRQVKDPRTKVAEDHIVIDMNEAEAYAYGTKAATPEQITVKAHGRKQQSGSVTDIVPEGTPAEVVERRLSDEEGICSGVAAFVP